MLFDTRFCSFIIHLLFFFPHPIDNLSQSWFPELKVVDFGLLDNGTCIANSNRRRDLRFQESNSGFKAHAGFWIPQAKVSWISESGLPFIHRVIF